jgi:hypothetical protein
MNIVIHLDMLHLSPPVTHLSLSPDAWRRKNAQVERKSWDIISRLNVASFIVNPTMILIFITVW